MNYMHIIKKIPHYLKNKYLLTALLFLLWIIIFDRNNLIDRCKIMNELHQLEKDKNYYIEWIENDKKRMEELKTSSENLEKFAREQYYMKKENEDIFIIVEEK